MAPPCSLERLPGNLSRQAADDLVLILRRSIHTFGMVVARRSRERLVAAVRAVEDGTAIGHQRAGRAAAAADIVP
jgi:hypothetical protein